MYKKVGIKIWSRKKFAVYSDFCVNDKKVQRTLNAEILCNSYFVNWLDRSDSTLCSSTQPLFYLSSSRVFFCVFFFGKIEKGKRKTDLSGAFVGFLKGGGLDIRTVNDIKKKINPWKRL